MKHFIRIISLLLIVCSALTACSRSGGGQDVINVSDPGAKLTAAKSTARVTTAEAGSETTEVTSEHTTFGNKPIEVITNYTVPTTAPTTVTATAVTTTVAPTTVPATAAPTAAPTTAARTTTTAARTTTTTPATEPKSTVTLSINCATILGQMDRLRDGKEPFVPTDGVILPEIPVDIKQGDSVFDVLKAACSKYDIQFEYSGQNAYNTIYIEGINQIYEKDCGSLSGWIFKVNGVQPQSGCSEYVLKSGDVVEWVYTCDLGNDV